MITTGKSSLGTKRTAVSLAGGVVDVERPNGSAIYLGVGGDLNCRLVNETAFAITKNLGQGIQLLQVAEINPTSTTASEIQIWE